MKKITLVPIVFLFLFLCSCGTANSRKDDYESVYQRSKEEMPSSTNRPSWADVSSIDEGDSVAFVGSSTKTGTEEESKQSAKLNAQKNISQYFGVSVSATFSEKRSKINGKRDSQILSSSHSKSREIEIKEFDVEYVVEKRGNGFVSYAKVSVPKSELARIQIELDAAGVWAIQSDIPQCEKKIRDLFPVFGRHGVNMTNQIEYSYKTPEQLYRENSKMFYLKVECKDVKSEDYNGEFYSIIQITTELFNLITGKTVNRWTAEGKGAAYSQKDAWNEGVSKAVEDIIQQIE